MHFKKLISIFNIYMTSPNKEPMFENFVKINLKINILNISILDEQIQNHENKAKSLDMRRRILKNQRSAQIENEYDKIKSILDHVTIPKGLNPKYYKNRIKYLEDMGAQAFNEK